MKVEPFVLLTDGVRGFSRFAHSGQEIRWAARKMRVRTLPDDEGERLHCSESDARALADYLDRKRSMRAASPRVGG